MFTLFAAADLELQIASVGLRTVLVASIVLAVCTFVALAVKNKKKLSKKLAKPLFVTMASAMIITTVILFGGTIYLNNESESKGPVHWHTGIEFWSCGAEVELRDPNGFLSNKIGTSTYHEHNDKFIHLEGVVVHKRTDASLEKFMSVTGGYLTSDSIGIPLNEDEAEWFASEKNDKIDGDKQDPDKFGAATNGGEWVRSNEKGKVLELKPSNSCGDSDGAEAQLQVFKYTYDKASKTYSQQKLADPTSYIMRDEAILGPPSDCVIVEYDTPRSRTDKLCQQYGVKDVTRCVEFGVKKFDPELCHIKETTGGTQ